MEQEQNSQQMAVPKPEQEAITQEQMIQAIYENTRKTMNYMKWQLYITIILIVLPLLAMVVMIPIVMKSLSTLGGIYGSGGLLQ